MDAQTAAAACTLLGMAMSLISLAINIAKNKSRARNNQTGNKKMELIEMNVPVTRDDSGWWSNPAIPNFDEDYAAYAAWLEAQDIETKYDLLQDEDESHPAYIDYYENEGCDVSAWDCRHADVDGWHTFSIHDSEDGPVWVSARRAAPAPEGGA